MSFSGLLPVMPIEFMTGQFLGGAPQKTGFWKIFGGLSGLFLIIGTITSQIKKMIERSKLNSSSHHPTATLFNNASVNRPVLSMMATSFIALLVGGIVLGSIIKANVNWTRLGLYFD